MRFLIVDHYYPGFTSWLYATQPGLANASYEAQRARLDDALFGETTFETAALRTLGHDASDALVNVRPLQASWAREHGVRLHSPNQWGFRLRRGLVPWPRRLDTRWMGEALLAQVERFRPDVVHIQAMDLLEPALVAAVKEATRIVVGQVATELPTDRSYGSYDLVVSSIPELVDRFRRGGADAAYLPLAFEPTLVDRVPRVERDVPVSFVGSFSTRYTDRLDVVEAVARAAPLQTWTADGDALPVDSPVTPTIKGEAWGRDMYRVLARSRLTINNHGAIARNAANNLRLYEATGMGAMLVTDARPNLGELFEVGNEVVTYRSAEECAEVVEHYLEHEDETARIAAAGQRRTLRDHTWLDRMGRLMELIRRRI